MVNYLYKLDDIETNHEAFAGRGEVVAAAPIRRLVPADAGVRNFAPLAGLGNGAAPAGEATKTKGSKEFMP